MRALQGLSVDRVPVLAVLGAYGGKLTGVDMQTLYTSQDAYAAGQQAVQEAFGFDMILAPFDFSVIAEAFGGEVSYSADQAPNVKHAAARTAEEVLRLPLPDPRSTGCLPLTLATTAELARRYSGEIPVLAVVPGPGSLPSLLMGMDGWLDSLLFEPEAAATILERTGTFFVDWADALLGAGANAVVVTEGMASAEIAPRELFEERLLPHLRTTLGRLTGPYVLHHTGGRIGHVLDLIATLPGLLGVVVSSKDSLAEARRSVGPNLPLLGNLDNLSLPALSPDAVRRRARACLEEAAPAGPYVLCHSGGDVPLDTPPENLQAMIQAAEEFAQREEATRPPVWICCSILRKEIEYLRQRGDIQGWLEFLDSSLHMLPEQLEKGLATDIDRHGTSEDQVILVYGECCAGMAELERRPNVTRVDAINCAELLFGRSRYRELIRNGAFVFLPEWIGRWRSVFEQEIGLPADVARELMTEDRKELVYADTGLGPVPTNDLEACAAYLGLPWRVEPVGLDHMAAALACTQATVGLSKKAV